MTTKVLLLGVAVAAFSFTSFAGSGAATLLRLPDTSQPSAANATVTTIIYVGSTAPISPRAQANQTKIIKGMANDSNPALDCRRNMVGNPKAVAECASHATMPGCVKTAMSK